MSNFSISFDPKSLSEIANLYSFPIYLSDGVQGALQEGSGILIQAMRDNMHWINGTGELSDSLQAITDSPYEIQVGSNDPKARRRNWGFSGMTDSLGRYYPNDPGSFYAENGMAQVSNEILTLVENAAMQALARIANG